MSESNLNFLPAEVRDGLAMARARDRRATGGRLRVQMDDVWFPIASFDETGFEIELVALEGAPTLRGLVEIHEGPRMIKSVLIVAGEPTGDRMRYDFKRATSPRMQAALDYERASEEPAGYLSGD